MSSITIYTDGSSNQKKDYNNCMRGGIGVYFEDYEQYNISIGYYESDATNSKMELLAALYGLSKCIEVGFKNITLYCDSDYIVKSMNSWAAKWEKNNWRKATGGLVKHTEYMRKLYELYKYNNVEFIHMNSHKDEPSDDQSEEWFHWYGNDTADKLANQGRDSIRI